MTETTALLCLPYIQPSQARKHVTHNEAPRLLDALLHIRIDRIGLDVPTVTPEGGERHVFGAAPEGACAGRAGDITAYQDGASTFLAPREGWTLWDASAEARRVYHDGAWLTTTQRNAIAAPA